MRKYQIIVVFTFLVSTTFCQANDKLNQLIDNYKIIEDSLLKVNPDSALLLLTNLAKIAFDNDSLQYCLNAQLSKVVYYSGISNMDSVYQNLKIIDALVKSKKTKFERIENWNSFNNNINNFWANYFYKIADYNKALTAFNKAIDEIKKHPLKEYDYYYLVSNYLYLGKIASINGDNKEALAYYQKGNNLSDVILKKYNITFRKDQINNLIAGIYFNQKKYKKSNQILEPLLSKRLNISRKDYSNRIVNGIISNHYKIAKNYLALNQFSKADSVLEQSKTFHRKEEPYFIEYLVLRASIFKKMEKHTKALTLLNEAEKNQIKNNQQFSYKSYPIFLEKGKVHQQQKEYTKALNTYKQAETCLFKEAIDTSIFSIANTTEIFHKKEFAELLSARANCLQNWHKKTDSLSYLQNSKTNIDLALKILESLRQEYTSAEARQFLIENSYPVFEKAIAINKQLWELTNKPEYFEAAFQAAEKSKSLSLTDALKKEAALTATGISDEALNKEKQFQYQIYQLKKEIAQLKDDSVQLSKKENELFKTTKAYKDFNRQLEADYPLYYQLKYQPNIITLKEVQTQLLDQSSALIEYFFGVDNLYTFYIDKNDIKLTADTGVHQIKSSAINFINSIEKEDQETYIEEANFLKNHILKPGLIEPFINKLSFVTDGQIAYIPFEVLFTETIDKNQSPPLSQLPYLIRQYTINYIYAANLSQPQTESKIKTTELPIDFLGIAPSFEHINTTSLVTRSCSNKPLSKLPFIKDEVTDIHGQVGGKMLLDTAANKANFYKYAPNSKIVHIASHACAGSTESENRIFLYNDEYVNMYDLHPLKFNSKMLVLSACETAAGSLKKGEGIMSLARSFFYTGVPSLTTTLWSVDDKSSAMVMKLYYKHLKKGLRKDEALRQAKLDYFKEVEDNKQLNPVYWAGFIHFGDVEPIQLNQLNNNIILLVLFILSLFLIISIYIYQRKKRQVQLN